MNRFLSTLFLSAALLTTATAHADSRYTYSYDGSGVSGAGNFTIADTATDGVFLVTSIDGQLNGTDITGLLSPGTYNNNDNLLYANDTYLDSQGVSFSLANGTDANIFYINGDWFVQGDGDFVLDNGSQQPAVSPMTLSRFAFRPFVAATPEPSSFALLGTGVLGIAGTVRRRLRKA